MPNQEFQVNVVDRTGKVLFDGKVRTMPNGFFELWLPRDRLALMTIRQGDRKSVGQISTGPDSATCLTTFQLQ